jgi:hypothetical protein
MLQTVPRWVRMAARLNPGDARLIHVLDDGRSVNSSMLFIPAVK